MKEEPKTRTQQRRGIKAFFGYSEFEIKLRFPNKDKRINTTPKVGWRFYTKRDKVNRKHTSKSELMRTYSNY